MLDKTLGGIWSQPDILADLNEGASPFSYLNGRLLNMIDPTWMMADSTGGSGKLPGAPEQTQQTNTQAPYSSQQAFFLNQLLNGGNFSLQTGGSSPSSSPNVRYWEQRQHSYTATNAQGKQQTYRHFPSQAIEADHTIEFFTYSFIKAFGVVV